MKQVVIAVSLGVLMSSSAFADDRYIEMSANPTPSVLGEAVQLQCAAKGEWRSRLVSATIVINNAQGTRVVRRGNMEIDGMTASYELHNS